VIGNLLREAKTRAALEKALEEIKIFKDQFYQKNLEATVLLNQLRGDSAVSYEFRTIWT
jgi:hypothetical protein